ncbi:MAG: glycerate kinase, partial [Kiritimatiellaceae bacterium]|nr:glycerate kinase [Kiritimatiellaceae bacterium]
EGTVDALVAATGGRMESIVVSGPLDDPVEASYGLLPDGTAIMEMASASGIELVSAEKLNPMQASTFGTGEVLRHLLNEGHSSIVMGIGGSATVDGGVGMAQALGFRFLGADGHEIKRRGGEVLSMIHSIDDFNIMPELKRADIRVACDVTNPLTGSDGAAAVFGPQKGATDITVPLLDAGLRNLQQVCGCEDAPGDGAAGGLGYGLRAFCGAKILPGARLVAEAAGLEHALEGADILITGEGRTDGQTASGKLCSVLAGMAREQGVKTLLLSGALQGELVEFFKVFDFAYSISSGHISLEECIRNAPEDLSFTARNAMRLIQAVFVT